MAAEQTVGIIELLEKRYAAPEWAFATEFTLGDRRADAVAVNLWASRGQTIVGIEIKRTRADWVSELRNPEKQERLFASVDLMYLAVNDPTIVRDDLPTGWGLLVQQGSRIVQKIKPKAHKATPGRSFWTRFLQHQAEDASRRVYLASHAQQTIAEEPIRKEYERSIDRWQEIAKEADERSERARRDLAEAVRSIEWLNSLAEFERNRVLKACVEIWRLPDLKRDVVGLINIMTRARTSCAEMMATFDEVEKMTEEMTNEHENF